jgi:hypothetical protein
MYRFGRAHCKNKDYHYSPYSRILKDYHSPFLSSMHIYLSYYFTFFFLFLATFNPILSFLVTHPKLKTNESILVALMLGATFLISRKDSNRLNM